MTSQGAAFSRCLNGALMSTKSWPSLSNDFKTHDGHTVVVLSNSDETTEMGRALRNGLMIEANPYLGMCMRGARQIVGVRSPSGDWVANAFLMVKDGRITDRFIRGEGNDDLVSGAPYQAIKDYLSAVNNKLITVHLDIEGGEFVKKAPDGKVERSLWERSGDHATGVISRFRAFAQLVLDRERGKGDAPPEVDFEKVLADEGQAWQPLSQPHTEAGLTFTPVATDTEMRLLGEELENNWMVPSMRYQNAQAAREGNTQFVAITDDQGIRGLAELAVVNGQVVPVQVRTRFEESVSDEVRGALSRYVGKVNAGAIPALSVGTQNFRTEAYEALDRPDADFSHGYVSSDLPPAQRHAPSYLTTDGEGYGDDGDYDDYDDEPAEEQDVPRPRF